MVAGARRTRMMHSHRWMIFIEGHSTLAASQENSPDQKAHSLGRRSSLFVTVAGSRNSFAAGDLVDQHHVVVNNVCAVRDCLFEDRIRRTVGFYTKFAQISVMVLDHSGDVFLVE